MPPRSRHVQRTARRLADQQTSRAAEQPATRLVITSITLAEPGAADDGKTLVTVNRRSRENYAAGYVEAYTAAAPPASGDRVICGVVDDQLVVLGRIVGFPPELATQQAATDEEIQAQ